MKRLDAVEKELDVLRDRAHLVVETIIRERLAALEHVYPRHKFRLIDGMGTTFFVISPSFMGDDHLSPYDFASASVPKAGRAIVSELLARLEEIIDIVERFLENFNMEMGDVGLKEG